MKFLLLSAFALLVILPITGEAQNKPTSSSKSTTHNYIPKLKKADYPFYVLVKRLQDANKPEYKSFYTLPLIPPEYTANSYVLVDIRTGKEIAWWNHRDTYHIEKDGLLVNCEREKGMLPYRFYIYDTTGAKVNDYYLQTSKETPVLGQISATPSTSWNKALTVFNRDLWQWDFDYTTGKLTNLKQVTQNGLVGSDQIFYRHPYAIINPTYNYRDKSYVLNIETGNSKAFFSLKGSVEDHISNRFILQVANLVEGNGYLDTQEVEPTPEDGYHHLAWFDKNRTISFVGSTSKRIKGVGRQHAFAIKSEDKIDVIPGLISESVKSSFEKVPLGYQASLNEKLLLFRYYLAGDNNSPGLMCTMLVDSEKKTHAILPIIPERTTNSLRYLNFKWLDNENIIYTAIVGERVNGADIKEGEQGTFVYSLKTRRATRITPYLLDFENNFGLKVKSLPEAGITVFSANNYIFRCKPDGSELSQVFQFPSVYDFIDTFITPKMN